VSIDGGRFARWAPDGRTLYFLALDNTLLAASIGGSDDRGRRSADLDVGVPAPLFQLRVASGNRTATAPYVPMPDGRFLVNEVVDERRAFSVIANWAP
jgi:hypothetical protein